MSEKAYKRSMLLELVAIEPMTSKEIAEKLDIPINQTFTYLSQFQKDGNIVKYGKKGKYNLYGAVESNPIDLLKQLYEFMSNENKCKLKNLEKSDIDLLEMIKRMIK